MKSAIYLDNNATTFVDSRIADRVHELSRQNVANSGSQHASGRRALKLLEEAKAELLSLSGADFHGMDAYLPLITSGGTEANNLALLGLGVAKPGILVAAATEHPSVSEAAKYAAAFGCQLRVLPVDQQGACDVNTLETWLKRDATRITLVSVMLGNNETGVIQDLETICALCRNYEVPVHSDAVQAIGKIPVALRELGLSAMTITAHKIHGPVGIGALIVDKSLGLKPQLHGGGQQLGLRPGTEPVIPTVALSLAVRYTCESREQGDYERIAEYRDSFEAEVCRMTGAEVIAGTAPRLPHTSNLAFPNIDRQALQMALDLQGVACSTGSACSSGSSRPSAVLVAMGLGEHLVANSLRFSFSRNTTQEEAVEAAEIVARTANKLQMHSTP